MAYAPRVRPMLPLEIPAGTTVESLFARVMPELHARLVPADAPAEPFTVTVRIEGAASYTVRIRGRTMTVEAGEAERPTLWLHTTAEAVNRFLEDAAGPRRFLPKAAPQGVALGILSDPRLVRRVVLAEGRVELAMRDPDGERLSIVLGFGAAARRRIDPDDVDVSVEAGMGALERLLAGTLAPEDALVDGDVRVRGNRLLALQLALALAPYYPAPAKSKKGP